MGLFKLLKFGRDNQRVTCIDFGGSFIKLASLQSDSAGQKLLAYSLKEFDASSSSPAGLSSLLRQIIERDPLFAKEAYLSISDPEGIFIKKISLPYMPKDELLNAVKWQLKGELPFNAEDSVSDLQVVREYADSDGARKIEIFCVFARKDIVNKYVSAASASGLIPQKVSCSVFNYCGILESLSSCPSSSAIFDIGHTHSYISIYQKGRLSFVRSLNFSVSKLFASLCGELVTDTGKVEIDFAKAEQLIRQQGVFLDETVQLEEGIKAAQLIPLMRPLLEMVVKEVERSFGYFDSENGSGNPEVLYITGGGSGLKNLDSYLASQLKVKVEKLPLPGSLDIRNVDAQRFFLDANQLTSAIGLSLSGSRINLIPPEIIARKLETIQKSALRVAAVTIAAAFAFSWFVINFQVRDYKKRLKIARLHLQSVEEIKNLKQAVDARDDYINKIHAGKVPSAGLLKLIGSVMPSSVIINEFDFDESSHSMYLSGVVLSSADAVEKVLTDLMTALEDSKFVREANLIQSKEEGGVNTFEIECDLAK